MITGTIDAYEVHRLVAFDGNNRAFDIWKEPETEVNYWHHCDDDMNDETALNNPECVLWVVYAHFTGEGIDWISDHRTEAEAERAYNKLVETLK